MGLPGIQRVVYVDAILFGLDLKPEAGPNRKFRRVHARKAALDGPP